MYSKAGSGGSSCVRSSWPLRTCDGDEHRSALTAVRPLKQGRAKCKGGNCAACGSCSRAGAGSHRASASECVCLCLSVCVRICVCVVDDRHCRAVSRTSCPEPHAALSDLSWGPMQAPWSPLTSLQGPQVAGSGCGGRGSLKRAEHGGSSWLGDALGPCLPTCC